MEKYHTKALEFDKVVELIGSFCRSELGRETLKKIAQPSSDVDRINRFFGEVKDALLFLDLEQDLSLSALEDISLILEVAKIPNAILDAERIKRIKQQLILAKVTKGRLGDERYEHLRRLADELYSLEKLLEEIDAVLDEGGNVKDNASAELYSVRTQIRSLKGEITEKLRRIINDPARSRALADRNVHVRYDRYTLAVRSDRASLIEGMVVDSSSTGKTLFVEPKSVVFLNNKLARLKDQEKREIERILKKLTSKIGFHASALKYNQEMLSYIDAVFSKARFALRCDANLPAVGKERKVHIVNGRHPLLQAVIGEKVVPLNLELGNGTKTLVITGPNTGGKTVALKTVGILTLMALSGLPVTAGQDSYFYVFSKVLADIGDEQSIENSLSTFSSHVVRLKEVCEEADVNSLVLIDELGTGTDPEEGSSLAVAIVEHLHNRGSINIITTHHGELKLLAYATTGMENASVEFDVDTLSPTYRLLVGVPGESNAFIIAQRLGLPQSVIERAKEVKGRSSKKETIQWILRAKEETNRALEEAKQKKEQALKELEKAKEEAEKIRQDALKQAEQLLVEVKESLKSKTGEPAKVDIKQVQNLIKNVKKQEEKEKRDVLKIGALVEVPGFGVTGKVVDIQGSKVEVDTGRMKLQVPVTSVKLVQRKVKEIETSKAPRNVNVVIQRNRPTFYPELNIVGKRVDDALPELERFLNDGYLLGMRELRVVHGKGEGILKRAVHEYLREHPLVKAFYLADENKGGSGVTLVELNL
ncbi:DNA mismatch repair protein MutS2 [Thermosulfidibacter takaii ABI70S6]|uniref:Endonuclease MutS2 n=1 Tax=Thermosulfidibacter takaii (strain DSM 17441 / JCM 13301 / NBRC 103674 / ABI70S6) TaxID=1298851 RepID=A0A0S3QTN9_THET7|nr:endonuclease MutS2 [Thermosulfidibacter takaii]BAT71707.1 DNA mismatch repair protein MutS2 [Thermosulfidibacter takaii ABI70S6]